MASWNCSRRSAVTTQHGVVATSQPLATSVGVEVLNKGGNAIDAAVAVAAALNVTEPCSTGIGGDAFCIVYKASTKEIFGLNGSGHSPAGLDLSHARQAAGLDATELPPDSIHCVTVPGAAALWCDAIDKWGTMTLSDVLQPAIQLAEEGVAVHDITADGWKGNEYQLKRHGLPGHDMMVQDPGTGEWRAPKAGEIIKMPKLAQTFRTLATEGKRGFYTGTIAESIVEIVQRLGGTMTLEDLAQHETTPVDPIHVKYRGVDVYELPPNGQGLTALMALNILQEYPLSEYGHNSAQYLHILIESMRCAFADGRHFIACPSQPAPLDELLSQAHGQKCRAQIDVEHARIDRVRGAPIYSSDTVYFTVVDSQGNACSFINSNYTAFGSGIIPDNCGFTLQNRGANFSLVDGHPNCLGPHKRPYHTIIPGMALRDGELYASFGVMGGFMQPQGHVQVLCNMLDFNMNPQQALDAARFCIATGEAQGTVSIEDGVEQDVIDELRRRGHVIEGPVCGYERSVFGRGQIIQRKGHVHVGGSDPRGDGHAASSLR